MNYIGMMENKTETAIVGCVCIYRYMLYWDDGESHGNCYSRVYIYIYMSYIGMMENKMETAIVGCVYIYIYMSHIGRMENEMETAIIGIYIYVYELYWDNGK